MGGLLAAGAYFYRTLPGFTFASIYRLDQVDLRHSPGGLGRRSILRAFLDVKAATWRRLAVGGPNKHVFQCGGPVQWSHYHSELLRMVFIDIGRHFNHSRWTSRHTRLHLGVGQRDDFATCIGSLFSMAAKNQNLLQPVAGGRGLDSSLRIRLDFRRSDHFDPIVPQPATPRHIGSIQINLDLGDSRNHRRADRFPPRRFGN